MFFLTSGSGTAVTFPSDRNVSGVDGGEVCIIMDDDDATRASSSFQQLFDRNAVDFSEEKMLSIFPRKK